MADMGIEFLLGVMKMFEINCGRVCTTVYIAKTMELYSLH